MKLTVGTAVTPRLHRKVVKGFGSKRPIVVQNRILPEQKTPVDPCDNSNDSGLGFEQHLECAVLGRSTLRFSDQEPLWANEHPEVKRKKLEIKLESDDANDNFSFPETMNRIRKDSSELGGSENTHPNVLRVVERRGPECLTSGCNAPLQRPPSSLQRPQMRPQPRPTSALMRRPASSTSLTSQLLGVSRDGKAHLQIVCQPEQQHRARYQTEGSRGAVKDRSGNGFPVVKLVGYNKPATLQVFIGTDVGRVAPHMFYQACRVSGKNSTPCVEKKIDGTVVIEVNFDPTKDMTITCDCVGILKERNVDVEHRFPDQTGTRNKKKSTRCRMVFRTTVTHPDGSTEVLQTTSQPIVCTQPPGIPEICKKSLVSCPCTGGMELFILGKNFLKDTRVVFQQNDLEPVWEDAVQPDKEFLQQTHLVCTVPPYRRCDLVEPVVVKLFVMSSGKTSEPHTFTYTPANNPLLQPAAGSTDIPQSCLPLAPPAAPSAGVELERVFVKPGLVPPPGLMVPGSSVKPAGLENQFLASDSPQSGEKKDVHPIRLWATSTLLETPEKLDEKRCRENQHKLMPPPPALLPIAARRASSTRLIIPDSDPSVIAADLKTEMIDENSQGASQLSPEDLKGIDLRMKPAATPQPIATVTDLMCTQSPSMATFRQFVSSSTDTPLPAQSGRSVESYLSRLESSSAVKPNAENTSSAGAVSSVSELSLNDANKIQTGVDGIASSLMFQTAQQTANLINDNRTSVPGTQQKNPFTNEVPLSNMFSSESPVGMEKEKTGYVESSTLQEAIAASLVAANLNSVGSETQRKAEYGPPPVSVRSQPMPPGILALNNTLPSVSESQLNNYQSSSESDATQAAALRVSPIMNNISQPSEIIQTAASLIFRNTPAIATKSIIPALSVSHKSDDQLMESLSKPGDQSSMLASSTPPASDNMNLQAPPSSVNQHLLAVSQAESALMSAPSDSRLEALVSSAIENHILTSDHQSQVAVTQKLNALVNSAAECHIINQCSLPISESIGLNAQTTDLHSDTSNQSPPNLRLEQSVSPARDFQLNSGSSSQQSVQIAQNNALNGHVLDSKQARENLALNMNGENMMVDTSASSGEVNSHILVRSPRSPIAIKAMILNSAVPTSVENQILVPSPTCTSSIAVKSMVLSSSPLENELHLPNTTCTSPIAIKSMLVSSAAAEENILVASSNTGSSIAVKNILNSSSINDEVHLSHSNCTSPIAMKKLILESSAALVNDIHSANSNQCPSTTISSILNSQVSGSSSTETSSLSAENAKIDVLVQSTVNDHILASSPNESSPPVLGGLLASSTVPTPMADNTQLQQGSLIITQAPSVPSSCSTTSITPASAQGVDEQLQQHITSMFVTSNSESSVQTINYTSGNSSLQPPVACVTNTACYSTADSNSSTCLASKLPELNVGARSNGSTTFVDQMLMGLAAGGERKNQLETPMITETNISKTIQEPEFLTAQSKISENEMFVTANGLKPTGNSLHNNMPRIMTKLDVAAAATAQEIPSSASTLPVPVAEMSDAIQTTKEAPVITTTAVVTSTVQKKAEEGMVPQELTQMSENDLLSYINPSCFDQVL